MNARRWQASAALMVLAVLVLTGCGGDSAKQRRAALADQPYSASDWTGCGGGYNSGSWDDAGRLYVVCGNPSTVMVYSADGGLEQKVPLGFYGHDVAPSPSGEFLYVTTGGGPPRRVNRQAGGGYKVDASWQAASYTLDGATYAPRGVFVATDGAGSIYLADGAWTGNDTHTVIKYRPDGSVAAQPFGRYAANSWSTGSFYWMLTGLTVTRDGAKVYTTEVGNNRVQRWDRQADGGYAFGSTFGGNQQNNADRQGYCKFDGWLGWFAAPYDVALDRAGAMYVMNTTCHQLLKFSAAGSYIDGWKLGSDATGQQRPHGFAVAANGDVLIGQSGRKVTRSGGAYSTESGAVTPETPTPTPPEPPKPTPPEKDGPPVIREPPAALLNVAAPTPQRLRGARGVALTTTCSLRCVVTVRATVSGAGAGIRARPMIVTLRADRARPVMLRLSAAQIDKVVRALRRGRRVTAKVTVVAKPESEGARAENQRRQIRLR